MKSSTKSSTKNYWKWSKARIIKSILWLTLPLFFLFVYSFFILVSHLPIFRPMASGDLSVFADIAGLATYLIDAENRMHIENLAVQIGPINDDLGSKIARLHAGEILDILELSQAQNLMQQTEFLSLVKKLRQMQIATSNQTITLSEGSEVDNSIKVDSSLEKLSKKDLGRNRIAYASLLIKPKLPPQYQNIKSLMWLADANFQPNAGLDLGPVPIGQVMRMEGALILLDDCFAGHKRAFRLDQHINQASPPSSMVANLVICSPIVANDGHILAILALQYVLAPENERAEPWFLSIWQISVVIVCLLYSLLVTLIFIFKFLWQQRKMDGLASKLEKFLLKYKSKPVTTTTTITANSYSKPNEDPITRLKGLYWLLLRHWAMALRPSESSMAGARDRKQLKSDKKKLATKQNQQIDLFLTEDRGNPGMTIDIENAAPRLGLTELEKLAKLANLANLESNINNETELGFLRIHWQLSAGLPHESQKSLLEEILYIVSKPVFGQILKIDQDETVVAFSLNDASKALQWAVSVRQSLLKRVTLEPEPARRIEPFGFCIVGETGRLDSLTLDAISKPKNQNNEQTAQTMASSAEMETTQRIAFIPVRQQLKKMASFAERIHAQLIVSREFFLTLSETDLTIREIGKVSQGNTTMHLYEILDGMQDMELARRQQTLADFQLAVNYYHNNDITKAAQLFSSIIAIDPSDRVAALFLNRATLILGK